jgi:hypothetical protein
LPITEPTLPLTGRRSALISPREAKTRAAVMPNAHAEVMTAPGTARASNRPAGETARVMALDNLISEI